LEIKFCFLDIFIETFFKDSSKFKISSFISKKFLFFTFSEKISKVFFTILKVFSLFFIKKYESKINKNK
jgi:hypothetical protein